MSLAAAGPRPFASIAKLSPAIDIVSVGRTARRDDNANDDVLHERAFKWLAGLPVEMRPTLAARSCPGVVNRIADLWGNCEYTRLHFQGLLIPRDGRERFPAEVRRELEVLQHYYFEHLSALPAILWNAVPLSARRIPEGVFPLQARNAEIDIVASRDYAAPDRLSADALVDPEHDPRAFGRLHNFWRRSTSSR